MFICIHGPGAWLLDSFSPRAERPAEDTLLLDLAGLDRLLGPPPEAARAIAGRARGLGLAVNIAVASGPDAALRAARGIAGITVIPPGEEAALLADLPLAVLDPPPEIEEALHRWGIRSLGALAALPADGVAARLGSEGVRLHELARGTGGRALFPERPPPVFQESIELEHPLADLESLLFLLGRLLHQLLARLLSHGLAAIELRLSLRLEDHSEHARSLRFPFPLRDHKAFLKLLQLDLDAHPPPAPIVAISLAVEPAGARAIQHGLFLPLAPEPEKLELTLARIAKLVGAGNVGSPALLDSHRPEAFQMGGARLSVPARTSVRASGPYLALRMFRPPLPAQVEATSGRPIRLAAGPRRGSVVSWAGPWRSSGHWWTPDPWARDEFDVALSDGALYRIYRNRLTRSWFIEGTYD